MLLHQGGDLYAVIDIGSNSVRLVVYDGLKRSPVALFNEKCLCGLAKNIAATGKLNAEGKQLAKKAIGRFTLLAKSMGVTQLHVFATSAVRDAKDGRTFVDSLQKQYNITVDIISGEREAYLAGCGVIASFHNAQGIVGDLGGGSLEAIPITPHLVLEGESHPIGPLRFNAEEFRSAELWSRIEAHLLCSDILPKLKGKTFYAVGGAFRNIAKLHMHRINYPLRVVHNFCLKTDDFLSTLQVVSRMSEKALLKIPDISKKRLDFLPFAARIMEQIVRIGQPKEIVFSSSGVREGFLFDALPENIRREQDVLLAGCEDIAIRNNRAPQYGRELFEWIKPLINMQNDREHHIIEAICLLSEISCYEHPEYRAEVAYQRIIDSSLQGISHKERVFMAAALYSRYCYTIDTEALSDVYALLSTRQKHLARIVGSAMRLGKNISGGSVGILPKCALNLSEKQIKLHIGKPFSTLMGEPVIKRLNQLSLVLKREPTITV